MSFLITKSLKNARVGDNISVRFFKMPPKGSRTDCGNAMLEEPQVIPQAQTQYLLFLSKAEKSTYDRIGLNCSQQQTAIGTLAADGSTVSIGETRVPFPKFQAYIDSHLEISRLQVIHNS